MKINKLTKVSVLFLSATLLIASCKKEDSNVNTAVGANESHLPADVLQKANELNIDPMTISCLVLPNLEGTTDRMIVVDGHADAGISVEEFLSRTQITGQEKQYSSTNIVDINAYPTITVFAYVGAFIPNAGGGGGIGALNPENVTALTEAIDKWNDIHRSAIQFDLTVGVLSDVVPGNNDIDIFGTQNSALVTSDGTQLLGLAEFPSANGAPGDKIRIQSSVSINGSSTNILSYDNLVKLYMHELGHTVGLRHTDWESRESCGLNQTGEGAGNIGVNYIYGTLPSFPGILYQDNSLMNACLDFSLPSEFNFWDESAVRSLYPAPLFDPSFYQFGQY